MEMITMSQTRQARLSEEAYLTVTRIASSTGKTQQEIIERAVRLYEREQFFAEFEASVSKLQSNPAAWAAHEAERDEWNNTLADGIDE
jgi:hypothetical protein